MSNKFMYKYLHDHASNGNCEVSLVKNLDFFKVYCKNSLKLLKSLYFIYLFSLSLSNY